MLSLDINDLCYHLSYDTNIYLFFIHSSFFLQFLRRSMFLPLRFQFLHLSIIISQYFLSESFIFLVSLSLLSILLYPILLNIFYERLFLGEFLISQLTLIHRNIDNICIQFLIIFLDHYFHPLKVLLLSLKYLWFLRLHSIWFIDLYIKLFLKLKSASNHFLFSLLLEFLVLVD